MQQWEYLIVIAVGAVYNVAMVNGEITKKPQPTVWDYLNQMGKEGWEVVTTASTDQYNLNHVFTLKRSLQAGI